MTIKEAAAKLERTETTIRAWIKAGKLEARKEQGLYGPEYVISIEAVEKAKLLGRSAVIIQTSEPAVPVEEMQRLVQRAMSAVLDDRFKELRDEMRIERMQSQLDLMAENNGLRAELARLTERLEEVELQKKPGLLKRIFSK